MVQVSFIASAAKICWGGALTSEMGQKLPKWAVRVMSALLPIATFERTSQEVRFVPISEVGPALFNRFG